MRADNPSPQRDRRFNELARLRVSMAGLSALRAVIDAEAGHAFAHLLDMLCGRPADEIAIVRAYSDWFSVLLDLDRTWPNHLLDRLLNEDNLLANLIRRGHAPSPSLLAATRHDLQTLQGLFACSSDRLVGWMGEIFGMPSDLPVWVPAAQFTPPLTPLHEQARAAEDWSTLLPALCDHYRQQGTGPYATYRAFRWHRGICAPVPYPDPIDLDDLAGYEDPKRQLLRNTEALLAGQPALNVLLYGSRGSGKSSLVKSLLSAYGDRGLRLLEVAKSDLVDLPQAVETLRDRPQKFVIFVDDLSFEDDDDAFKALKVVLEGSLVARPRNTVVYATSNRRHLVREFFGDRPRPSDADEIHHWDTVQEKLSFSDRFGLTLTFEAADQPTYLAIVRHLAARAGLDLGPDALTFQALQWATRHNGRSGRTARQFVDTLIAGTAMGDRP
jgi:uncharacterized protein